MARIGDRVLVVALLAAAACDEATTPGRDAGQPLGSPEDASMVEVDAEMGADAAEMGADAAETSTDASETSLDAAEDEPDAGGEPTDFYDPPFTEEEGSGERELSTDFVPEDPSIPGLAVAMSRMEALGAAARIGFSNQNPRRPETVSKLHLRIVDEDIVHDPASGAQYAVIEAEGRRVLVLAGSAAPPEVEADFTLRTTEPSLSELELVLAYLNEPSDTGPTLSLGLIELQIPETGAVVGASQFPPVPLSDEPSCVEQALLNLDLPDLDFHIPPVQGCSKAHCVQVVEAWLMAHYSVFRVRQMLEYMAGHNASKRVYMWSSYPVAQGGDALLPPDPPELRDLRRFEDWFGGYVDYRFEAIRRTYNRLWNRLRSARVASTDVRLLCPDQSENPGNVCFTAKPHAHHVVTGYVNLCTSFFGPTGTAAWRTRVLMHEMLHHIWVEWNENNLWKAYVLTDSHIHGHGNLCTYSVKTEPMYGTLARHLATYKAQDGDTCWHRNYALRNPDNYANFAANIGHAVYDGQAVSWPHPPPSPPAPQGPNPCDEGAPAPNPGPPFQSGANDCQKLGGELFCPHPNTEGGVEPLLDALELFPVCP